MSAERWEFWIDRGGTFTDCLGQPPGGGPMRAVKVLSSDQAPLKGIRQILDLDPRDPIPPCDVRMGTTVATNALLERRGAPTALVVTAGFGDLLEIGDQTRPDLFALNIRKHERLCTRTLEVNARLDATGAELSRPTESMLRAGLAALRAEGILSLAVLVIHSTLNPALEQWICAVARDMGFSHVTASHELYSGAGMLARGDTAATSAYLTPLLADYLHTIASSLPGSSLQLMASSGRLRRATQLNGQEAVYSGPAGGVVACAQLARTHRLTQVIGFDMGGTSTDVYRYAGTLERRSEQLVDGIKIRASMLKIDTVAAGGGSICRVHRKRLMVGPESAGAMPGPLCYGDPSATALTLTDVNLYLGRISPERFPLPLHRAPVHDALVAMSAALAEVGVRQSPDEIAQGFVHVANVHAAQAIRRAVLTDGYDLRDHDLIVFGGAGGQHACAVADELGIRRFFVHPLASLLSAWGIGLAREGWNGAADLGDLPLEGCEAPIEATVAALAKTGIESLGLDPPDAEVFPEVMLQTVGTETAVAVPLGDPASMRAAFLLEHERRFGFQRPEARVEAVEVRVEVIAPKRATRRSSMPTHHADVTRRTQQEVWSARHGRTWVDVIDRGALEGADPTQGPCLVVDDDGVLVVAPGWAVTRLDDGTLCCVRDETPAQHGGSSDLDPVLLEVFAHRFMAIATHMGDVLQRTAISTNIRDRLDFSCALFDLNAGLVANAPHIPVHLGAMAKSVAAVAHAHPQPLPGDAFVTNDPAGGGSHLPDITVVTPVHDDEGALRFWVASRGHHAEIGGATPGSMPPFSTSIEQEGIVLRAELLTRGGALEHEAIMARLQHGPFPSRAPAENIADLEAQLAANRRGVALLRSLCERYGVQVVEAYMGHIQDDACAAVTSAIAALPDGSSTATEHLDDGTALAVRIDVCGAEMTIDFAGTAPAHAGNLNAPRAVTVACVLYVLRTLVGTEIPLNQGCLTPVRIRVPPGSLLDPPPQAAVAAGNVETSQRVVDMLLRALGLAAASQGTMNNLSFGGNDWGYYETIAGGAGATESGPGADAVHTHMTNTRITDPELLERRYPLRVERFAVRRGSGGEGTHSGGDGVVRRLRTLEPLTVSMISGRREVGAPGLAGGASGRPGENLIDGATVGGSFLRDLPADSTLEVRSPGGGGFGAPPSRAKGP